MKNKVFVEIKLLLLILIISSTTAYAARYIYSYERGYSNISSTNARAAVYLDDWTERGDAQITKSSLFPSDGIRLECHGTKGEPSMAAAIYRFSAPPLADYLKIKVYYKDISNDDEIAARLFIRTKDEFGREEGRTRYGDTFLLRSDRLLETIHIAAKRYLIDETIEIHIVASDQDIVEVKKIQLESLQKKPEVRIIKKYYPDFWTEYPRYRYIYNYYYYGPYFWPDRYNVYVRWIWPDRYYWEVWRPYYTTYVRVYVREPHWYRSYVTIYDDQPSFSRNPQAVITRRQRVSRSIVTKSKIRSFFYSRTPNSSSSNVRRYIPAGTNLKKRRQDIKPILPRGESQIRREYVSYSNSNYFKTKLKRRRQEQSQPTALKTTIRQSSISSNRGFSNFLGRVLNYISTGSSRTRIKHQRHFSSSFSPSSNRSRTSTSSHTNGIIQKHRRQSNSNSGDNDEEKRNQQRRLRTKRRR